MKTRGWTFIKMNSSKEKSTKKKEQFFNMMDRLPPIKNARTELELLLQAIQEEDVPQVDAHVIDNALRKRTKKDNKCKYC